MPIYAYRCETCGFRQDVLQRMSDARLTVCPSCGQATFEKQVTAAGFQLKGSGWYVTDFRNPPAKPGAKGDGEPKGDGESKGDAKAESTGDAKGDAKAEPQGDAGGTKGDAASDRGGDTSSAPAPANAKAAPAPSPAAPSSGGDKA